MEKVKVMVVDDSKISRAMISGHLAKTNFEVVAQAKDAAEAVQLYQETNPTIVTMDMNLPDADGIECTRRIRSLDSDAKIVMISAMKDAALVAKGRAAGVSAFLQKPVSTNDLIDTLMILCQNKIGRVALMRESYAKAFVHAFQQGIFSMLGEHCDVDLEVDESRFLTVKGIAVIIGLTGTPAGRAIFYLDPDTAMKFASQMLGVDELTEDEASETIEEAANIIIGRSVSSINDIFKDKEMRITPPGTIFGDGIKIASLKLTTFKLSAKAKFGTVYVNVGFAEGE